MNKFFLFKCALINTIKVQPARVGTYTDGIYPTHIAANGGFWMPIGGYPPGLNNQVTSIMTNGDDVYVGLRFTDAGGIEEADNIAKWNGSSWEAMCTGLNAAHYAIEIVGTNVYVGGYFTFFGENVNASYIAKWNNLTGPHRAVALLISCTISSDLGMAHINSPKGV